MGTWGVPTFTPDPGINMTTAIANGVGCTGTGSVVWTGTSPSDPSGIPSPQTFSARLDLAVAAQQTAWIANVQAQWTALKNIYLPATVTSVNNLCTEAQTALNNGSAK